MNRYTSLAVAVIGVVACSSGCQNSGTHEAKADADRPAMTADATAAKSTYAVDTSTYTVPYTTTIDAPWMHAAADTTNAGTLTTGDTIWLRSDAPANGIVSAKTADGRIVYVRRADLRAK